MKRYIYTILVSLLAVVGCRDMGHTPGKSDGGQVLDLSVSIENGASKAPITGATFANGTHLFGLAVTKTDGVTAYESGAGHVWASAVVAGAAQTWTYKWGSMSAAGAVLPVLYGGDPMLVAGYYPYNSSAGVLAGRDAGRLNVPFDLTTTAEQSNQTDVLYSGVQAVSYVSGARQSVALSFRHVYALLEFQVKLKREGVAATITKVEVCNKAGKTFLSNKGFFSPGTGALTASTAGNVSFATSTALNGSTYATIRVMVPPALYVDYADYANGDIYVQLYDNGSADPKQFPILRAYLTQSSTYGLVGGGRYTYKLLYEHTAYGSITVVGWQSSTPVTGTLGGGDISGILPIAGWGSSLSADATLGNGPLPYVEIDGLRWATGNLVADGANGCKIGAPGDYGLYFQFGSLVGWTGGASGNGVGTGQPALAVQVRPSGYIGKVAWTTVGRFVGGSAGTGYGLPTTDVASTGIGDPCRVYLGVPWRTPTAGEYLTLLGSSGQNTNKAVPLKLKNYDLSFPASGTRYYSSGAFDLVNVNGFYWASSVYTATEGGFLAFENGNAVPQNYGLRTSGIPVRCVRATSELAPLVMRYGDAPFAATGDLIGMTSRSYNDYTGTVASGGNGGRYFETATDAYANEMPYSPLAVAWEDENGGKPTDWATARSLCANKRTDGGGWRLPRLSEVHLILMNKTALEALGFARFSEDGCWSATEYNDSNAWYGNTYTGSTDNMRNMEKTHTNRIGVRCVRENK